jgi:hypothetical protein
MAKGDPSNVSKFVRVFADQIQLLENATIDVKILRQFAHAENAQLDEIGAIVDENRQGKSDAEYRIAILARINTNASRGEPERLISALRQITNSTDIHYVEYYPGKVRMSFSAATVVSGLLAYLQQVCPGGVQLILDQYSTTHPFRFDIGPDGFDTGHLATLIT